MRHCTDSVPLFPSYPQISTVLAHVAKKEKFTLPPTTSSAICSDVNGNLRKALLVLEALRMQSPDLSSGIAIAKPDWEVYIARTADLILSDPSPQNLLAVRSKLYELLVHAIPPTLILKHLTDNLVKKVDGTVKGAIVQKAAFYELRTRTGSKVIFHLEAFVASVMHIQKAFLMGMNWDD